MRDPYWELGLSGGQRRNPIVCGRRFCIGCGRWRHAIDFGTKGRYLRGHCRACYRGRLRVFYRQRTPEQRERRREYERFWTEVQRRRRGIPARSWRERRNAVDHSKRVVLDTEPLVKVLNAYHAGHEGGDSEGSWRLLARKAGVPDRAISRYMSGESRHVVLDQADRITHALGIPLSLVYPYEEAA